MAARKRFDNLVSEDEEVEREVVHVQAFVIELHARVSSVAALGCLESVAVREIVYAYVYA